MTPEQFVFWCQGFIELADPQTLNEKQTKLIKQHLALVFYHSIDPSYTSDPEQQKIMQSIHDDGEKKKNSIEEIYKLDEVANLKPQSTNIFPSNNKDIKYRC